MKGDPRPIPPANPSIGLRVRQLPSRWALALASALLSGACAPRVTPLRSPAMSPSPQEAAQKAFAAIGADREDGLPGYAGAVGIGDAVVHSSAAGWADVAGRRPATRATQFRIYSTSKSIGAVVAMRLVEAGRLNLDAPLETYLPTLPTHVRKITVRHLLAHRSGIRHYRPGEWDRVSRATCARPQEALADFIQDPLQFEPGTGYQYTTFGYVLLTAVLEAAAGQPFEVLLREQVLIPAGMVATALEGHPAAGADQAMFYDRSEAGGFSATHGIHASCKFFGGGLVSTAEDLVRFGLALVNGRLISPASLALMLTIHSADGNGSQPPYGFGFFPGDQVLTNLGVSPEDYVPAWWHGGNGRGGYSVLIIYPERRAAAAVTTNVRASGRLVGATHALALPFLRTSSVPPGPPRRTGALTFEKDPSMSPSPTSLLLKWVLPLGVVPTLGLPLHAQAVRPTPSPMAYPGAEWERISVPESIGFSSARLRAIADYLKGLDTTAVHVSVGGRTLFEYGDLSHQSYLASARKSVLAALYGKYVESGTIPLSATLGELGITDTGGLLPRELGATVEHILAARSGVYHPASNPGDSTDSAPPRGSQRPGDYFLYNNWDFNAAGTIFEKATGKDIYEALRSDLAVPTGMQDFKPELQQKYGDKSRSDHAAYHMTFSTRDMARFGLLVARGGKWKGQQVIPESWVKRMTSLVTPMNGMNPPEYRNLASGDRWGYGLMWWVWDAQGSQGPFTGAFSAMGAGGQFITVLPALDMVITHKTDPEGRAGLGPQQVSGAQYSALLRMFIAAKLGRGESAVPRVLPSPEEARALELLKSGKVKEGVEALWAVHQKSPIAAVREERLNLMAYQYSGAKQMEEALAIFALVTRIFPASANAWDSYGECLLASGKREEGLAAYRRSLKLAEGATNLDPTFRKQLIETARKALATP